MYSQFMMHGQKNIKLGFWILAIKNKNLKICLGLKKLGLHKQEFRSKSV